MTERRNPLAVMVVDPGCFTPAYDAELCRALALRGERVTLVTAPHQNDPSHRFPPEFPVLELFFTWHRLQRLGRWRKFVKGVAYPWYCRRLVRLVARAKPDVLHYQWMRVPPVDLYVMRQIRRRSPITSIVVTMHNVHPLTAVAGPAYLERVLDLANGVVVHGRESKGQLLRKFPALNPSKVAVIPHGPLHMQTAREDAGGQHPDRDRAVRKRVGLVFGEIKSYKGLDVLAEAVSLLTEPEKQQLRLVIAGKLEQPSCRADLERLSSLGIDVDMKIGYVPSADVPKYFRIADFVLLPYKAISQSGVLLTALSQGRLVIASALGDMTELIAATKGGWSVPPANVPALAAALRAALARTSDELHLLGAQARENLLRQFSWDAVASSTSAHYRTCKRFERHTHGMRANKTRWRATEKRTAASARRSPHL
jgi:glycosyltransferase involved in cell wall biosynthesis